MKNELDDLMHEQGNVIRSIFTLMTINAHMEMLSKLGYSIIIHDRNGLEIDISVLIDSLKNENLQNKRRIKDLQEGV